MSHTEIKTRAQDKDSRALWHLEVKPKREAGKTAWISVYCEVEWKWEGCGNPEGKKRMNFKKEQEVNYTDFSWEIK